MTADETPNPGTPETPTSSPTDGVPLDQSVNPDENPAPSEAALAQPDLGGGILQQQAADAAVKFDPAVNTVDPAPVQTIEGEHETFPDVDTNATSLPGEITQATLLRADMLRLAVRPDEDATVTTARASAYLDWIYGK